MSWETGPTPRDLRLTITESPPPQQRPRPRRAASNLAVVLALTGSCAVVAATVIITPTYLGAAPTAKSADVHADSPHHQRTIELIGRLISGSEAVLGMHERSESPLAEVTLWLADEENRGTIDEGEIAVLSHSRALQTVSLYLLEEQEDAEESEAGVAPGGRLEEHFTSIEVVEPEEEAPNPLEVSDIDSAAFCARWRDRTDVRRRVLATRVSDLDLQLTPHSSNGRQLLRISLTWPSDSSDSTDRASLVLDVPTRDRP